MKCPMTTSGKTKCNRPEIKIVLLDSEVETSGGKSLG